MNRKTYTAPEADIEKFYIKSFVLTLSGLEGADNEIVDKGGEDEF